jgi:limonene-1,2-epoxide hydrolase
VGFLTSSASTWSLVLVPSLAVLLISIIGERDWASPVWFAAQVGISAISGVAPVYAVLIVVLALGYWDLEDFGRRLAAAPNVYEASRLERRHLRMLAAALSAGSLISITAVLGEIRLSFIAAAASAIFVALGLSYILRQSRTSENA